MKQLISIAGCLLLMTLQACSSATSADQAVSAPMTVIAYAWGDMVTDVIQPFWAIPLLGVAKLSFRDIMGYCMIYFLFYMILISVAFLILPYVFAY